MNNTTQQMIFDETSEQIIATAERLALQSGGEKLTVRMILQAMGGVSNRVFYNRFKNIDDVLSIVYQKVVLKLRESLTDNFDPKGDFFEQVINIVTTTLTMSYDVKMNFSHYVFETDSVSNENFEWWKSEITKLIEIGKSSGALSSRVDTGKMGYAIWCFIRGYNVDALSRGLPREEAVENFKYAFRILLEGMAVCKD